MIRKLVFITVVLLQSTLALQAQTWDPDNKYLVWTKNVKLVPETNAVAEVGDSAVAEEQVSFEDKFFKFYSLCEWMPGMKFMVLPEKKDLVIKTFAKRETDELVGSMTLRYKIMEYRGHSGKGLLHERVDFHCIDDDTDYYYELPTATFEDYCNSKFGVPTLAYLGDVDIANRELVGKTLLTVAEEYNIDTNSNGYGFEKISMPEGTPVTVMAVGVGTRHFPVKIIVEDKQGRQFFQNVAFSRTNSGLRDEEFEEDNRKHVFHGSFVMESDNMAVSDTYKKYIGQNVYTLYATKMIDELGQQKSVKRITPFTIDQILAKLGTNYVTLMMTDKDGKKWKKDVTFVQEDVAGDIDGRREDYFFTLFAEGDARYIRNVREENMEAIRKGHVRAGFTEEEVQLALGEPDGKGKTSNGLYTWVYKAAIHEHRCTVYFYAKSRTVKSIK